MRVISGKAKGRKLKRVPGDTTRPIMDRAKENLFNLLGGFVVDSRWLDLFGGTGQVGIEALSRGAREVIFTDNARAAIRTIQGNLATTKLSAEGTVLQTDAFRYLEQAAFEPFDVVYVAPPQYMQLWERAMAIVEAKPERFLTPDGVVVVQIDPKEFVELSLENLVMYDQRTYGNTMFCFYELAERSAATD